MVDLSADQQNPLSPPVSTTLLFHLAGELLHVAYHLVPCHLPSNQEGLQRVSARPDQHAYVWVLAIRRTGLCMCARLFIVGVSRVEMFRGFVGA